MFNIESFSEEFVMCSLNKKGPVTPILGNYLSSTSVWMTHEKPALMTSTQKGNYVYGYQNTMDLYTVYCVKMAQHRTSYPEVKAQICNK